MNAHRENGVPVIKPDRTARTGLGWALLMILGAVIAVLALITRCTELI